MIRLLQPALRSVCASVEFQIKLTIPRMEWAARREVQFTLTMQHFTEIIDPSWFHSGKTFYIRHVLDALSLLGSWSASTITEPKRLQPR